VPANAVGFAASRVLAAAVPEDGVPAHLLGGAIFGAVLGLLTGGVLVRRLLRVPGSGSAPGPAVTT
jgi:hypothetical protein